MDLSKIKLIIWDLDDTFWKGTLSEGEIELIPENCAFVKQMVDRGIMNSICSKNTFADVEKVLKDNKLWDFFVFPSIDWTPKGSRIKATIAKMGLRPVNVLFIDDNPVNLNEAQYYLPELNTLNVCDLADIISQAGSVGKDDSQHKRLKQYRIMERKAQESESYNDTADFLMQSQIKVNINKDCLNQSDRIAEMVMRTNQLNFTKLREREEEIVKLLKDEEFECATISVKDKYGDYGIVGFYALNIADHTLRHFLFSCRTIGMGIEQYVYETLNYPTLSVTGEVASNLQSDKIVNWINTADRETHEHEADIGKANNDLNHKKKVLLKGPCDLSSVKPYIERQREFDIDTEFNYINDSGIAITAMNHSVNIIEGHQLSESQKQQLLADVPFMDMGVFKTKLYNTKYDFVFYSLLPDCHEGVYQHIESGKKITFSSFNYDLTDKNKWGQFISGEAPDHNFKFTEDELEKFSRKFKFIGPLGVDEIIANIKYIREEILPKKTQLVLVLGSEIECETQTSEEFANHAPRHREVNSKLIEAFGDTEGISFINVTELIDSQSDFSGATNHFKREIYFKLANVMADSVSSSLQGKRLHVSNNFGVLIHKVFKKLKSLNRKR